MCNWANIKGSQSERPLALDTTSSAKFVYQRRNIERVTIEEEDGLTTEMWQYEERKLTKDEYAAMLEEELTATQLALTEMYERQMG